MDLLQLKRNALLIPTPGQTEQIYLAGNFEEHFGFVAIHQNVISAEAMERKMRELNLKKGCNFKNEGNGLNQVIKKLIGKVKCR
jgi:hypothetical protein